MQLNVAKKEEAYKRWHMTCKKEKKLYQLNIICIDLVKQAKWHIDPKSTK